MLALALALASVTLALADNAPRVIETSPLRIGTLGGAHIRIRAEGLSHVAHARVRARIGATDVDFVHMKSDVEHGLIVVVAPPMTAGTYAVSLLLLSDDLAAGAESVALSCARCTITFDEALVARASAAFASPAAQHVGVEGETVLLTLSNVPLLHHPPTQVRALVGSVRVRPDEQVARCAREETRLLPAANARAPAARWHLHVRLPQLVAGMHPISVAIERATPDEDAAHGAVALGTSDDGANSQLKVLILPKVTHVSQTRAGALGGALIQIHGSGFSPRLEENDVTLGGHSCEPVHADVGVLTCELRASRAHAERRGAATSVAAAAGKTPLAGGNSTARGAWLLVKKLGDAAAECVRAWAASATPAARLNELAGACGVALPVGARADGAHGGGSTLVPGGDAIKTTTALGADDDETDVELVSGELAWPAAHPTALGTRAVTMRVGALVASGEATLRVPRDGWYTFGVDCAHAGASAARSALCSLEIVAPADAAADGAARAERLLMSTRGRVRLAAANEYVLRLAFVHLEHGHTVAVRVAFEEEDRAADDLPVRAGERVSPPPAAGARAGARFEGTLPAAWLSPPRVRGLAAGSCEGVRVLVRGLEAVHHASSGCLFEPPSHAHTAAVRRCSLDGVQVSADPDRAPALRVGSRLECEGEALDLSARHADPRAAAVRAREGAANGAEVRLVFDGDDGDDGGGRRGSVARAIRVCSAAHAADQATKLACTMRHLDADALASAPRVAELRVWTSGGGWARMPTPALRVRLDRADGGHGSAGRRLQLAIVAPALAPVDGMRPWPALLASPSPAAVAQAACFTGGDCVVPAGERWLLDADMSVRTLTVLGELSWDTRVDGLTLRAGFVLVGGGGRLRIGSASAPMALRATVYIEANGATHHELGERFLGAHATEPGLVPSLEIYGRPLGRTWSLLAADVAPGESVLRLQHAPVEMGWRVGDRVGIASTLFRVGQRSTTHQVVALGARTIEVDPPLAFHTAGGRRLVAGQWVEMSAEVVNLARSVTITGSLSGFFDAHVGLHTIISRARATIEHARLERCGQRGRMGRYCMHLHMCRQCPTCRFAGNAIEESQQGGITVHGTHSATVERNVLWCAAPTPPPRCPTRARALGALTAAPSRAPSDPPRAGRAPGTRAASGCTWRTATR